MWVLYVYSESTVITHCRSNWKLSSQMGLAALKKKSSACQSLCYRYASVSTRTWSPSCKGFSLHQTLSMALKKMKGRSPVQALQCKSLRVRMLSYPQFRFTMLFGPNLVPQPDSRSLQSDRTEVYVMNKSIFHIAGNKASKMNNKAQASRRFLHSPQCPIP